MSVPLDDNSAKKSVGSDPKQQSKEKSAHVETKMEAEDKPDDEESITVYLGAELYSQRMFPYSCPSF